MQKKHPNFLFLTDWCPLKLISYKPGLFNNLRIQIKIMLCQDKYQNYLPILRLKLNLRSYLGIIKIKIKFDLLILKQISRLRFNY